MTNMPHRSLSALQTLLEQSERERDAALAAQQRAENALRMAEQQAQQLSAYQGDCQRRWGEQFAQGSTMTIVNCYQGFIGRLGGAVQMQGDVVTRSRLELDRRRADTVSKEIAVASVRKLIERRMRSMAALQARHEQKGFDEIANRLAWERMVVPGTQEMG